MLRGLLRIPFVYRAFARFFNTAGAHRELVALSGYAPGERVLDVGCGPGDLGRCFRPEDYVGVDISQAYIDCARRAGLGTFHVLPAERVGELDDQFDLAVMFGVFHHLSDGEVRQTLAGLARVLKPRGRFVLLEAVWPSHFWDLPGYLIRKLDRGQFVRTAAQWRQLLGETWRVDDWFMKRNISIEYFGCRMSPPEPTHAIRAA